jgi:XTP/dITP diphosphohydrolase
MNIWLASNNADKKIEIAAVLDGYTINSPSDNGIIFEPNETGKTFLENALIKANALFDLVREPVIADDSGLCVDLLNGRPGLFSSCYGVKNGKKPSCFERNKLLLEEIEEVSRNKGNDFPRTAFFVCAMALMLGRDRFFLVQETLEGEIAHEFMGNNGFGFDPVFFLPERNCTLAEISLREKNMISHRGKAIKAIAKFLE